MKARLLISSGLLILVAGLIHFSCQREVFGDLPPVTQNVNVSITGRVLDENREPVNGATVRAGSSITITDINGDFRILNATMSNNTGYVKVEKQGYFNGSRTFVAKQQSGHYVEIQLIPLTVVSSFSATTGGSAAVQGGGNINFPAGVIINDLTGAVHTGNVNVAAYFIDPTGDNFADEMPGSLRGINTGNEEVGLRSYGMVAVRLLDDGGAGLNLAQGKTATISLPIPSALQASAPASIPLWFFDETTGLWKQEGSATKQGGSYVGTVSHFSFWNCDAPFPTVGFEAIFKDQNGNPLQHNRVNISTGDLLNLSSSAFTDSSGRVSGMVPANTALSLEVFDDCNNSIHTQTFSTTSNPVNLGVVTVTVAASLAVSFTGTVTDCNNAPVANGVVRITIGGTAYAATVTNGSYSRSVFTCGGISSADLVAFDLGTSQQGITVSVPISAGSTITQALTACGTAISEFLNYTINGVNYSLIPATDSISAYQSGQGMPQVTTYISGMTANSNIWLSFDATVPGAPGTYPLNYLTVTQNNTMYIQQGTIIISITEYGNVNEFIAGSFNGTVRDSTGSATSPINCNFRVKREQ